MSSSSSSQDGDRGEAGNGSGGLQERERAGDFEAPSSSRRRTGKDVWPEPFLEALALRVAIDASVSLGRLAAAASLFNLFQVCSTWLAVSRSNLLWQNLTQQIWNRRRLLRHTWRDEYTFRHRTARNFRMRRYVYTTLQFEDDHNDNNQDGQLYCCRLALSDNFLAAGFSNGSVRLFHLPSMAPASTFRPHHRNRLGRFSRAVSGIILSDTRLVFASVDGDIHVAPTNADIPTRRTQLGDIVNDGVLVDFTGCNQWWVGLYAGVPGRAFHVWNGEAEELVFIGGWLTDPEAVTGWHLLTELTEFVGRVRVTSHESAVACSGLRAIVFDLRNQGTVLGEEEFRRGIIVASVDASYEGGKFVIMDNGGGASVRRADTLEEICSFNVGVITPQRRLMGCMNQGYVLTCAGGVISLWEAAEHGGYLYSLEERIGEVTALVADDRHVASCFGNRSIHLWDFGAQ